MTGRPPACQPSQCDAGLLSSEGGMLQIPELQWPLSQILTHRVALAQIQQKINNVFYAVATARQRLSSLEEADSDLVQWKEELPLEIRPEEHAMLDGDANIDIYMIHLDYFNLLRTIHWSLINHWLRSERSEDVARRLRASESICLGACLTSVRTLNA
ncbi:hypothetical protein LTR84_005807 [Exophiala bonariae]|uniref:Uncharacterized protein n=1 Tax=Exophiala bonariae TaxID=1690606 RepID=A0AAV9N5N5_9EURO|nr:hypothetical protein LTR84_005807 [Exophiala bonariae]